MQHRLFILISLPLVLLASSCGKGDDQPAVNTQPVATAPVGSCPAGQMLYNNTCVAQQYGQPPGYTGPGYQTPPPGGYCQNNYWANGYSYQNNCWSYNRGYGYRWYYYGGVIWYW